MLVSTCGLAPAPSAASAQGQMAPGFSPNHSVVATGTTPSDSSASCSTRPTTTIRWGSAGMVVVPNLCAIETGKASEAALDEGADGSDPPPQAASRSRSTVAATVALRRIEEGRTAVPFCQRGPRVVTSDGSVG